MIKSIALSAAIVVLTAGIASAKPATHYNGPSKGHYSGHFKGHQTGKLTLQERISLARKRARLAQLKRRIVADGIITKRENTRLKIATSRYKAAVRKDRRD